MKTIKQVWLLAFSLLFTGTVMDAIQYNDLVVHKSFSTVSVEQFLTDYCRQDHENLYSFTLEQVPLSNGTMANYTAQITKKEFSTPFTVPERIFSEEEQEAEHWYFSLINNNAQELLVGRFSQNKQTAELVDLNADDVTRGNTLMHIWQAMCQIFKPSCCYLVDGAEVNGMKLRVLRPLCTIDARNWYEDFGYELISKSYTTAQAMYKYKYAAMVIKSLALKDLINTVQVSDLPVAKKLLQDAHDVVCVPSHDCCDCMITTGQLFEGLYALNKNSSIIKELYDNFFLPYLELLDSPGDFDYSCYDTVNSMKLLVALGVLKEKKERCKIYSGRLPLIVPSNDKKNKGVLINLFFDSIVPSTDVLGGLINLCIKKQNFASALRFALTTCHSSLIIKSMQEQAFFSMLNQKNTTIDYPLLARTFSQMILDDKGNAPEHRLYNFLNNNPQVIDAYIEWVAGSSIKGKAAVESILSSKFGEVLEHYLYSTGSDKLAPLYSYGSLWRKDWITKASNQLRLAPHQSLQYMLCQLACLKSRAYNKDFDNAIDVYTRAVFLVEKSIMMGGSIQRVLPQLLDIIEYMDIIQKFNIRTTIDMLERYNNASMLRSLTIKQLKILAELYLLYEKPVAAMKVFGHLYSKEELNSLLFTKLRQVYCLYGQNGVVQKHLLKLCLKELKSPLADTLEAAYLSIDLCKSIQYEQIDQKEYSIWFNQVNSVLRKHYCTTQGQAYAYQAKHILANPFAVDKQRQQFIAQQFYQKSSAAMALYL